MSLADELWNLFCSCCDDNNNKTRQPQESDEPIRAKSDRNGAQEYDDVRSPRGHPPSYQSHQQYDDVRYPPKYNDRVSEPDEALRTHTDVQHEQNAQSGKKYLHPSKPNSLPIRQGSGRDPYEYNDTEQPQAQKTSKSQKRPTDTDSLTNLFCCGSPYSANNYDYDYNEYRQENDAVDERPEVHEPYSTPTRKEQTPTLPRSANSTTTSPVSAPLDDSELVQLDHSPRSRHRYPHSAPPSFRRNERPNILDERQTRRPASIELPFEPKNMQPPGQPVLPAKGSTTLPAKFDQPPTQEPVKVNYQNRPTNQQQNQRPVPVYQPNEREHTGPMAPPYPIQAPKQTTTESSTSVQHDYQKRDHYAVTKEWSEKIPKFVEPTVTSRAISKGYVQTVHEEKRMIHQQEYYGSRPPGGKQEAISGIDRAKRDLNYIDYGDDRDLSILSHEWQNPRQQLERLEAEWMDRARRNMPSGFNRSASSPLLEPPSNDKKPQSGVGDDSNMEVHFYSWQAGTENSAQPKNIAQLPPELLQIHGATIRYLPREPSIVVLGWAPTDADDNLRIRRARLSGMLIPDLQGMQATVLLFGAAGSGKTKLANLAANYLFGVQWQTPYRLNLSCEFDHEDPKEFDHGPTEWTTVYDLCGSDQHGGRITIVDTPGLGQSQQKDDLVARQLQMLLKGHWLNEINAICIVSPASAGRLTAGQKVIFSLFKSMFGESLKGKTYLLATFADAGVVPAEAALRQSDIEINKTLKFNNACLYANNRPQEGSLDDSFSGGQPLQKMFWDIDMKSLANLLKSCS